MLAVGALALAGTWEVHCHQLAKQLDDLLGTKRRRAGVDIATTVVRDYPHADAIVRQVLKYEPDMLIAESHRHGKLSRLLLDQTCNATKQRSSARWSGALRAIEFPHVIA
jgi:nucleotide-binding universal stress UspA family protein